MEYKELSLSDIKENLLDNFNRYQKVTRRWHKNNGVWLIVDCDYIDDWDETERKDRVNQFFNIIFEKKGYIFGAYKDNRLKGFSVLLNERFGTNKQYVLLKYMHVSLEYRHQGIGKKLFEMTVKKAKEIYIEKIYMSANNSEATQKFYLELGCIDATEINEKMVEKEPFDRQMEYVISYEVTY
ncbi:MAG: GNAT family N-acetyltransferase [Candidatus Cloacimonetes bacterium]|nr:GNAT family N-acetyltransferase [Candidatus Cloacimonadota bacterium]